MSEEEAKARDRECAAIDFRNEIRELVQDAIRSERENPVIVIKHDGGLHSHYNEARIRDLLNSNQKLQEYLYSAPPIPMILTCPMCCERHIDEKEFATKPHHTHSCQKCGFTWRPAVIPTVGVQFLPGFKNKES